MEEKKKSSQPSLFDFDLSNLNLNFKDAADYAFLHHLNKPYTDGNKEGVPGDIIFDGSLEIPKKISEYKKNKEIESVEETADDEYIILPRPNHNIVHSIRVSLGDLPVVADFLSVVPDDPKLRDFFDKLKNHPKLMELLKIIMLFSVAGRNSEAGMFHNPKLAKGYRELTVEYLETYLKSINLPNDLINIVRDPLKNMCNEKYVNGDATEEQKYLYFLFTIAHKLDLPRFLDQSTYRESLDKDLKPIVNIDNNIFNIINLEMYGMNTLIETGNRYQTYTPKFRLNPNDKDEIRGKNYNLKTFQKMSLNVDKCIETIEKIEKPTFLKSQKQKITIPDAPELITPSNFSLITFFTKKSNTDVGRKAWAIIQAAAVITTVLGLCGGIPYTVLHATNTLPNKDTVNTFVKLGAEVYGTLLGIIIITAMGIAFKAEKNHATQAHSKPLASIKST